MRPHTVIQMSVQRLACTACGAEAHASCNCGKPYVPAKLRAKEAIRANPQKSDRAIAADIGTSDMTVGRARKELGATDVAPEREGRDGKVYRLPVRQELDDEPSDEDHAEGLRVIAVRGFLNRAAEAKEIATIGKLRPTDDAAAAWFEAAQNLRRMIQ
jgi:hypothetical protein